MQNGLALAQGSKAFPSAVLARADTDENLLERIAEGDKLAMRTLYGRHNVKVYRFVLRFVSDAAKAEDIVSEVFFDVWRQAASFEGRSQVSTWILGIARFKALTALRQRQDDQLDEAMAETIPDQADDPETAMDKKREGALLRMCIEQLSQSHREVIDLVYYHETTVEQTAQILGVPLNTVKTRMFYARKRISELYMEACGQRSYNA